MEDDRFDDGYTDTSGGDYPAGASVYGAFDMAGNVYEWLPIGSNHIDGSDRKPLVLSQAQSISSVEVHG